MSRLLVGVRVGFATVTLGRLRGGERFLLHDVVFDRKHSLALNKLIPATSANIVTHSLTQTRTQNWFHPD